MKVIIDIVHPADVNFYKNAIHLLNKQSIEIDIIVRSRGNLVQILEKECVGMPYTIIGRHYSSLYGKVWGFFKRFVQLNLYLRKKDFNLVTGFSTIQIAQSAQIYKIPSVIFYDDYEYKLNFLLCKLSATRYVIPASIPVVGKNITRFDGFKELAYLHPKYFKPNKNTLKEYGLKPNEYVFIREVSGTSLNYKNLNSRLYELIPYLKDMGFDLLLSIENKSLEEKFSDRCIILKEPVNDIHSLIKYAALTISSGDTIPRESCMVGTPAIHTGRRDMCVNKELIAMDCMFKVNDVQETLNTIKDILENDLKKNVEKTIRHAIKYEWDDTTEIIVENLINELNN